MAKTTGLQSSLDNALRAVLERAVNDAAAAVRTHVIDEVSKLVGATPARTAAAAPAPTGKRRGRPPKAAAAPPAAKAPAAKPAAKPAAASGKKKPSKFVRRSPEQITADNARLLSWIGSNPNKRSEDIQRGTGIDKQHVASGLQVLRDGGKIKMKGVKRAATYSTN